MDDASAVRADRELPRVAVIGAGTMGAQIAALTLCSGRSVRLFDQSPQAVEAAGARIAQDLVPAILSAGVAPSPPSAPLDGLAIAASLAEAVSGVDLVIEAVREDVEVKRQVHGELSLLTDAILATNSSSLPSSLLASAVDDPGRLLNMHFFAPIWIRTMLEVMTCGQTRPEVLDAAVAFGRSLGLTTALVRTESKGFIINRIWRAVKRESLRVVDEGVADPEDVDRLWMIFFQTEFPPFGTMDMVGLDVVEDIESTYQAVTLDPTDVPSPTLRAKVAAGELGEKTGRGFYEHPNPAYRQPDFVRLTTRTIQRERDASEQP